MTTTETVEFAAICIRQNPKAIKVLIGDREDPVWIPQVLIDEDSEVYKLGQKGTLIIPEWFALKEGLI